MAVTLVVVVEAVTNGISWMNARKAAKHTTQISVLNVHSAKAKKPENPKHTRWLQLTGPCIGPVSELPAPAHVTPVTSVRHSPLSAYRKGNRRRRQVI